MQRLWTAPIDFANIIDKYQQIVYRFGDSIANYEWCRMMNNSFKKHGYMPWTYVINNRTIDLVLTYVPRNSFADLLLKIYDAPKNCFFRCGGRRMSTHVIQFDHELKFSPFLPLYTVPYTPIEIVNADNQPVTYKLKVIALNNFSRQDDKLFNKFSRVKVTARSKSPPTRTTFRCNEGCIGNFCTF